MNDMSKWGLRILGIFFIVAFMLLMLNLQKQLMMLQRQQPAQPAPASSTSR